MRARSSTVEHHPYKMAVSEFESQRAHNQMSKNFQKRVEDFVCQNCGHKVEGCGYTNHCPRCLVSKHVDKKPGDRENDCGGLMDPIDIEKKGKEYVITHKCRNCGEVKKNKTSEEDNFDIIIEISKK